MFVELDWAQGPAGVMVVLVLALVCWVWMTVGGVKDVLLKEATRRRVRGA